MIHNTSSATVAGGKAMEFVKSHKVMTDHIDEKRGNNANPSEDRDSTAGRDRCWRQQSMVNGGQLMRAPITMCV